MSLGARIKKADAVIKASSEGPLSQALGVHTDEFRDSIGIVESVQDPDDLMQKAPAIGSISLSEEFAGDSIRSCLENRPDLTESIYLNPNHDGFVQFSEVTADEYAIQDAEWLDDPESLAWKSGLGSQIVAKDNALNYFEKEPSSVQFESELDSDPDLRAAFVQRARQLAEELRNEALQDSEQKVVTGKARAKKLSEDSESQFRLLGSEDSKSSGFTKADVDKLFEGGA